MAMAIAELYWIRMLFKELHCSLTTSLQLWCDNMGALSLASNPIFHARPKYIEIDYHFIHENILNKDFVACYIYTVDQCADIFTKGLTSSRFLELRDKLMLTAPHMSLRAQLR